MIEPGFVLEARLASVAVELGFVEERLDKSVDLARFGTLTHQLLPFFHISQVVVASARWTGILAVPPLPDAVGTAQVITFLALGGLLYDGLADRADEILIYLRYRELGRQLFSLHFKHLRHDLTLKFLKQARVGHERSRVSR